MGRILSIDYGTKRVGIAVTDPLQLIANALTTVETSKLIEFLKNYVQKEGVEAFVLGFPKNLDNTATDSTAAVLRFKIQLEKLFPDKLVHLIDERFTSKIAVQSMVAGGMKKKDRRQKGNIDKVSAVLLLQSFMEQKR